LAAYAYKTQKAKKLVKPLTKLIKNGLENGLSCGWMTRELLDMGIKPEELVIAVCLAMSTMKISDLNPVDALIKQEADKINDKIAKELNNDNLSTL